MLVQATQQPGAGGGHADPVDITVIELRRAALPLVRPFRTSFGEQTVRDVLYVRAEGPQGEGWGECQGGRGGANGGGGIRFDVGAF